MTDNVILPATGETVAADDIGGVFYQQVKLINATADSTDPVGTDAYPMPTKDAGPGWTSIFGVAGTVVASADMTTAAHVTDAPTTGQKIVVTDILVSVDTAMSVLFEDHTGTDLMKVYMPANSTLQITPRSKLKLSVANDVLTAKASVAGNIAVTVWYYSEA
jgi:hypothetical protein